MVRALLLLLLAGAARGAGPALITGTGKTPREGSEELVFIGWNDACAVAIQHMRYPPVGRGLEGVPSSWRIGTLTIPPAETSVRYSWPYESGDGSAWDEGHAARAVEDLVRAGFSRQGPVERIRDAPVAARPGLAGVIDSTGVFRTDHSVSWPPSRYALTRIQYSPLGTCAFAVFEDRAAREGRFSYRLIRILNPESRRVRARAHATNGLLLYKASDLYGASEELAIAAETDPDYAHARYYNAVLLSAQGLFDEALAELRAAIALDRRWAEAAKKAPEFASLRKDRRFLGVVSAPRYDRP